MDMAQRFEEDMLRCRGVEFARLGMTAEVDGNMGTVEEMNASANLVVRFDNEESPDTQLSCHPTWNVKYFDNSGSLIAHFDGEKCLLRRESSGAAL
ncbi:hypothetical protein GIW05_03105 [Pseudomonas syringae]|nr:hypothetical protein [Pseudomonas syringae]MCF5382493.1 hypothetical protein [Pseudomonas syringae]MCF5419380.1 hypothetical protein [Pseudomonas syringae]MCF5451927.1 hypothetical protein [Pseudomonas syringae]MCF5460268.1 hypothetical protein [Pseudomonas syringae]